MDQTLYKNGRQTGYTKGTYSGLKERKIARKIVNGEEVVEPILERCVVVGASENVFSKGGDSGSIIFDENGRAFGLLFGGAEDNSRTFFTHVHDLSADIRRITGASKIRMKS